MTLPLDSAADAAPPAGSWRFIPAPHPQIEPIPAFDDNYLWLILSPDRPRALVVDPGDAEAVQARLDVDRLSLAGILLTHHHGDHVGGVAALAARHRCPVWGPEGEPIERVDYRLRDGDRIAPAGFGLSLEVLAVPGHTRAHIAYFSPRYGDDPRPVLFCGDTLFAAGCGRLFEGTAAQMVASLDRLAGLPPETLVYCAHEYTLSNLRFALAVDPGCEVVRERHDEALRARAAGIATVPSAIAIERQTNPFLRTASPGPRAAAAARLGREPTDALDAFTALREWKNTYR